MDQGPLGCVEHADYIVSRRVCVRDAMDGKIKQILNVVVVIVVVIWVLQAFGVVGSLQNMRVR